MTKLLCIWSFRDAEFEASRRGVTVAIPLDVWETIRRHTPARFDLADKTDAELSEMVEAEVARRIEEHNQLVRDKKEGGMRELFGSLVYGSADEARGAQVAKGLEHYRREQQRQQEMWERIKQHQGGACYLRTQ